MKRQSKAEEALAKQCKNLEAAIDSTQVEIGKLYAKIIALRETKDTLDAEIRRLRHAREVASARVK